MAALDKGIELEATAGKIIGRTEVQNKAGAVRHEYGKFPGSELIRGIFQE